MHRFYLSLFKVVVATSLVALLLACSGEGGEIEKQYARLDFAVNTDNAVKVLPILTEDFGLDVVNGEPAGTYLFNGAGPFKGKNGRGDKKVKKMIAKEFYLRMHGAAQGGDQFKTTVESIKMEGETATAEISRTQVMRGGKVAIVTTYTSTDEWKKQSDGTWKMTASHVKSVKQGQPQ